MRLLVDTHILIWMAMEDPQLPDAVWGLLRSAQDVAVSTVTIWEVAIKHGRQPVTFPMTPQDLLGAALAAGWRELPVLSDHAIAVAALPRLHGDPFDRLLVAQALSEGLVLVTADRTVARYDPSIRLV